MSYIPDKPAQMRTDGTVVNPADGINTDGSRNMQLTGSKSRQVNQVILANALALTDINNHYYDGASWIAVSPILIPNWNNYNRHLLTVISSLDQAVDIILMIQMRGNGVSWDALTATVAKTSQKATVPASGQFIPILLTKADMVGLDGIMPYNISMQLKASVAPTTGSITIVLEQWAE